MTTTVGVAGSQGNFELNCTRPIIISNLSCIQQAILADGCEKFRRFSVEATERNRERTTATSVTQLMLVTARLQ